MKKISVLVMCISVAGCRLLLDVDKPQCEVDVHCTNLFGADYVCGDHGVCEKRDGSDGGNGDAATNMEPDAAVELDARFECIHNAPKDPPKPADGTVLLDVTLADFLSLAPPADVLLNTCNLRDSMCLNPLHKDVALDANGMATAEVPYGFDGFFEAAGGGYVPAVFSINKKVTADLSIPGPSLLTPTALQALAATNQDTIEPGMGVVIVEIVDCNGEAAEGVVIEIDGLPDLRRFYIDGSLPNLNLTSTKVSTGISAGMVPRAVGGFTNVPPGFQTVDATLESPQVAYSRASVIVRPDTMTFVRIYPGITQ